MLHCNLFTDFLGLKRKNDGEKRRKKGKDRGWKKRHDYNNSNSNRNSYNKSKYKFCVVFFYQFTHLLLASPKSLGFLLIIVLAVSDMTYFATTSVFPSRIEGHWPIRTSDRKLKVLAQVFYCKQISIFISDKQIRLTEEMQ